MFNSSALRKRTRGRTSTSGSWRFFIASFGGIVGAATFWLAGMAACAVAVLLGFERISTMAAGSFGIRADVAGVLVVAIAALPTLLYMVSRTWSGLGWVLGAPVVLAASALAVTKAGGAVTAAAKSALGTVTAVAPTALIIVAVFAGMLMCLYKVINP